MSEYWLSRDGRQFGPYHPDALRQLIAEGHAAVTDLVWAQGMSVWEPMSKVLPPSAPPPPPQPLPPPPPPPVEPHKADHGSRPASGTPVPPSLHWALVILFIILTLGVFSWIWLVRQASFVRKLDPSSSARLLAALGIVGLVAANICGFSAPDQGEDSLAWGIAGIVIFLGSYVFLFVSVFQMRRSMLNYYHFIEPIGLRLSGAMTFFFGILYLQYHMSRIARWKQTGFLTP